MVKDTLKILVIDDNPADAGLLRRLLGKIDQLDVDFAHCLNEADGKEALSAKDVDCLFLDYQLGETSGLDMLDSIRALGHDLAVIVLTGAGDESVAVEAMKRGAQDYLVKDVMVRNVLTPKRDHGSGPGQAVYPDPRKKAEQHQGPHSGSGAGFEIGAPVADYRRRH